MVPRVPWNPLSASTSVCTVRKFGLDGTPLPYEQQDYSDYSSLTSVFERIPVDYFNLLALEPNRLLRPCHIRSRMGIVNAKVGVASKIRARLFY